MEVCRCKCCLLQKEKSNLLIGQGFWGKRVANVDHKNKKLIEVSRTLFNACEKVVRDENNLKVRLHSEDILKTLRQVNEILKDL